MSGSHKNQFRTYAEYQEVVKEIVAKYPRYVKEETIGESVQKRPITVLHLTDFESKQPKTQVLLSAMAHGREAPTTLVGLTYVTDWLERLDKKDPEALAMSLRRKVTVHWCYNPDTYIANEKEPSSMIRKNRNPGVCAGQRAASMGVDLNRNFPMYGEPPGNTADKCGETYNGGTPFSEPETKAAKKLVESNKFTFAMSIHAHGMMLILPGDLKADDRKFCDEMRPSWIKKYGSDMETVGYKAPGSILDFWYKDHNILGMCFEVGNAFWPSHGQKAGFLSKSTPLLRQSVMKGGCTLRVEASGDSVKVMNDGRDACLPLKISSGQDVVDVEAIPARSSKDVAVKGSPICIAEAGVPFCLCDPNEIGGGTWKTAEDAICKTLIGSSGSNPPADPAEPGTPGDATPGDATPGDATPGDATPGDATPGDATPGSTDSEGGMKDDDEVMEMLSELPLIPVIIVAVVLCVCILYCCCKKNKKNKYPNHGDHHGNHYGRARYRKHRGCETAGLIKPQSGSKRPSGTGLLNQPSTKKFATRSRNSNDVDVSTRARQLDKSRSRSRSHSRSNSRSNRGVDAQKNRRSHK